MPHYPGRANTVFWLGTAAVTAGVALHLPYFFAPAIKLCHAGGHGIGGAMQAGMALILVGTAATFFALLPADPAARQRARAPQPDDSAPPSGRMPWMLLMVLTVALAIDSMKPASIGFVVPGMMAEYGLGRGTASLLPFFALSGTMLGSFLWGVLADWFGRRAAILLAAVIFIGSSICGAMPSFAGNVVMCFVMGLSAGGLAPIAFTLMAESLPPGTRGAAMVLFGGLGTAGGYLLASLSATVLEPVYGWRVLWLLGLPTGLLLMALQRFMPESPGFLSGAGLVGHDVWNDGAKPRPPLVSLTISLNAVAVSLGLVTFGVILWLPAELRAHGVSVAGSDLLLARSTLLSLPVIAVAAGLFVRWGARRTLLLLCSVTVVGLLGLGALGHLQDVAGWVPLLLITVLLVGSNGLAAVLLPFTAICYPTRQRGRGTGFVAGNVKLGGVAAQLFGMTSSIPSFQAASLTLACVVAGCAELSRRFGAGVAEPPGAVFFRTDGVS